jgi:cysteinyl-tRNA synthetase
MSEHFLGEHFDLHGGGQDLVLPHHENEIAQSEGAHGHVFVNYWLHSGFVRVDNEKMSKSLENFFTVREVLKGRDPEDVRFFLLRPHYRSPLNYSDQQLGDARAGLTRLYTALRDTPPPAGAEIDWRNAFAARFKEAMDDDFNTAEACAALFDLASEINRTHSSSDAGLLKALGGVVGLLGQQPVEYLQKRITGSGATQLASLTASGWGHVGPSEEWIDQKIDARAQARKRKDFAESVRIRYEVLAAGILLEDGPGGTTTWRRR